MALDLMWTGPSHASWMAVKEKCRQARGGTYWRDGNLCPARTARCRGGRQESHCVPLPASTCGISMGRVQRGTYRHWEAQVPVRWMEQRHVLGDHGVGARIVGREGEGVQRSGRRTCLSCNSALLRMSASASRVAIMQLLMAEASILTSRCGPLHTEGSKLFASRQEREGRRMCVECVCCPSALRTAVCGAVRWVTTAAYRGCT